MRRPHVFERSAPRGRRLSFQQPSPGADREVADALPALIRVAEAGGQSSLAYLLTLAKLEAERAARRAADEGASSAVGDE